MEIWAVVLENKDESGGEVKAVGFVQSNLLKKTKVIKKEAKPWQQVLVYKLEIHSESEVLLNHAVNKLME